MVRESELQYWNDVSVDFMTDESDDEEDANCIVEHKHTWRSASMIMQLYSNAVSSLCIHNLDLNKFSDA